MKRPSTRLGAVGQTPASMGAVVPNALYRLDEVKARMGWRDAAFRAAVRAGLKTHRSGKRLYVLGSDLIDFVTKREAGR
jgi:hypothetical protein